MGWRVKPALPLLLETFPGLRNLLPPWNTNARETGRHFLVCALLHLCLGGKGTELDVLLGGWD